MSNSKIAIIYEIHEALKKLGVQNKHTIEYVFSLSDEQKIKVNVDNEYFGIWDANKKTFVD